MLRVYQSNPLEIPKDPTALIEKINKKYQDKIGRDAINFIEETQNKKISINFTNGKVENFHNLNIAMEYIFIKYHMSMQST